MSIHSNRVGIGEDIDCILLPGYLPWIYLVAPLIPILAKDFAAYTHITHLIVPA